MEVINLKEISSETLNFADGLTRESFKYYMRKFMNEYKVLKSFLERSLLCPVESENYQNYFISFLFYELKLE